MGINVDIFTLWDEIEAEDIAKREAERKARTEAENNAEYSPEPKLMKRKPKPNVQKEVNNIVLQPDVQDSESDDSDGDGGDTC